MRIKYSLKTALNGLKTNRSRSALTILGIVIGITAIILIMSLGKGAQDLILNQIQGMGSKTLAILPGRQPEGFSDVAQIFSDSLKEKDLEALKKKSNVPNLGSIMPVVFGPETSAYENESYRTTVFGGTDLLSEIFDIYPSEGTFFTDDDVKGRADTVILGAKVKQELFGGSEAVGQKIKLGNKTFRVIGVLAAKGQVSFFNFDEIVIVPYTTAQQYLFGIKFFHRIIVEADSEKNMPVVKRDIELTLRETHDITDPSKDDFHVETPADIAQRLNTVTSVLTLFLTAVAAISLVVGGIGIMNIMLVSVTERTREIGLRKALGATEKDILNQFLLEAVILTTTGGVVGILLGSALSFLSSIALTRFAELDWTFVFPVSGAIIGFGVAAGVGLIFGLYPAKKASQKSPIEALRYE